MSRSQITGVDFGSVHSKYGYIPRRLKFYDEHRDNRMAVLRNQSLADTHRHYSGWRRHDGPGDAFRHGVWSYRMTREYGTDNANNYGDDEIDKDKLPRVKSAMDRFNQSQGRRLAQRQFFGNEYAQERPAFDYIDDRYREYYSYYVGRDCIKDESSWKLNDVPLMKKVTASGQLQTTPYKRPKTSMF
ncbi:uncharacterized protein LOC100371954 [Saccoglossus kowalevskii]|uniref:Uncharacterized protein LOC100371954 n=1 Tax=Saccoglossus kowalevskii TaxID=10224 RepID=A0ABM0H1Z7_SACKO|nr:PREDICTED: uncharacterized protein LOC100371954 [Saccoglossus kowalevskii]